MKRRAAINANAVGRDYRHYAEIYWMCNFHVKRSVIKSLVIMTLHICTYTAGYSFVTACGYYLFVGRVFDFGCMVQIIIVAISQLLQLCVVVRFCGIGAKWQTYKVYWEIRNRSTWHNRRRL